MLEGKSMVANSNNKIIQYFSESTKYFTNRGFATKIMEKEHA